MLTLDGVVAGYGGGDVLHGVFLECAPSTVTCVIGPNGAGKSTVLRVISGLLTPVPERSGWTAASCQGSPRATSCATASCRSRSPRPCSPR